MSGAKVFFDTNVLVAAFAVKGICAEILELGRVKRMTGVTSEFVLTETRRVLSAKLKFSKSEIDERISIIREALDVVKSGAVRPEAKVCPFDRADEQILSAALESSASHLVTGDQALLALGKIGGLTLIRPRDFLSDLERS